MALRTSRSSLATCASVWASQPPGPQSEGFPERLVDHDAVSYSRRSHVRDLRLGRWARRRRVTTIDTTMALGYIGDVLMTTHDCRSAGRLRIWTLIASTSTGEGHTEFCAGQPPQYCYYMFGLPPFMPIP
jgi:hypothetical protein